MSRAWRDDPEASGDEHIATLGRLFGGLPENDPRGIDRAQLWFGVLGLGNDPVEARLRDLEDSAALDVNALTREQGERLVVAAQNFRRAMARFLGSEPIARARSAWANPRGEDAADLYRRAIGAARAAELGELISELGNDASQSLRLTQRGFAIDAKQLWTTCVLLNMGVFDLVLAAAELANVARELGVMTHEQRFFQSE